MSIIDNTGIPKFRVFLDKPPDKSVEEIVKSYIKDKYKRDVVVKLGPRTEVKLEGHPPHYDYGYDGNGKPDYHMSWCKYSASYLKSCGFEGGEFCFLNDDNSILEVVDSNYHLNKILLYSVHHKHKVNPTIKGERRVELNFFSDNTI